LTICQVTQIKEAYRKLKELISKGFHDNIDLVTPQQVGMDADGVDHFGNITYK